MPQAAKVSSVEAIEAFRNALHVYRERASNILDDVRDQVARTRTWLEADRKMHWRRLVRDREGQVAQAEAELLTARLSGNTAAMQDRRLAVNRARTALSEATDGLERVHRWLRNYEAEVESRTKPVMQLRNALDHDLEKALAFLAASLAALHAYAEMPVPPSSPSPVTGAVPDGGPQP